MSSNDRAVGEDEDLRVWHVAIFNTAPTVKPSVMLTKTNPRIKQRTTMMTPQDGVSTSTTLVVVVSQWGARAHVSPCPQFIPVWEGQLIILLGKQRGHCEALVFTGHLLSAMIV